MDSLLREQLHPESENFNVWCERCQKIHPYYTFTREDHDRVISEAVKKLADRIDQMALESALKAYGL